VARVAQQSKTLILLAPGDGNATDAKNRQASWALARSRANHKPMQTLILMRHAKAVRDHEAPTDRARGLTERGRRDAADAGAALIEANLAIDMAQISDAQRTRETFAYSRLAARAIQFQTNPALYHAPAETIWRICVACAADAVLVTGHNPGLQELVAHLVRHAHDNSQAATALRAGLPTAAWAAFDIQGDGWEAPGPRLIASWRARDSAN
jgi:phosphohistidine phosphatase